MKNDPKPQATRDDGQAAPKVSRRKFLATTTAAGAGLATAATAVTTTTAAAAQNDKKPATPVLTGKMTEYKSGDLMIPAYVARPKQKRRAPAKVQEWVDALKKAGKPSTPKSIPVRGTASSTTHAPQPITPPPLLTLGNARLNFSAQL